MLRREAKERKKVKKNRGRERPWWMHVAKGVGWHTRLIGLP